MKGMLFDIETNPSMAQTIAAQCNFRPGKIEVRKFPDGESYVRLLSEVKNQPVYFLCSLHKPDEKILPLLFACRLVKEFGAQRITLISSYLPYMRQDKRFTEGEAISSRNFAELLSMYVDELITIDPHLHRFSAMSELYSIPTKTLHASAHIARYIRVNIKNALVIGPDSESAQWVEEVARQANVPHLVLQKERLGDKEVKISIPRIENYRDRTPVLVDDIVSTAHTMIETVQHLKSAGMNAPVCIAVHPVFAGTAFEDLKRSGATEIISCNTILHPSNKIDITQLIIENVKND